MSKEANKSDSDFNIADENNTEFLDDDDVCFAEEQHVVVCPPLQSYGSRENRALQQAYQPIAGRPLELRHCTDAIAVRKCLVKEFPYATGIIDKMLTPILNRTSTGRLGVAFEPTLIYGSPGLGKTRFVNRICSLLGLYTKTVSVAGASDDLIFGLSKGYSTARASIVTDAVLESMSANPVIILDELEKVNTESRNGNLHHKLLPLLEKSEACRWNEPLLSLPVDFSHVSWIFTANDLNGISPPLRSRIQCLEIKSPELTHLPLILDKMRSDIAIDQGMDVRWFRGLDLSEMSALQQTYKKHRSLRILKRQLEFIVEQQNQAQSLH